MNNLGKVYVVDVDPHNPSRGLISCNGCLMYINSVKFTDHACYGIVEGYGAGYIGNMIYKPGDRVKFLEDGEYYDE